MGVSNSSKLRVKSRKWHVVFSALMLLAIFIISSCAVVQSESVTKIALLAPFEGRYREIGYNALYAVRLAMTDSGLQDVNLLAVDDGSTVESAIDHIKALNIDPTVEAIIVLGQFASHPDVQQANDKPLIIVGYWGHESVNNTLMAINPDIINEVTTSQDITVLPVDERLSDLYGLEQASVLHEGISSEIVSSGSLPDANFRERYITSDLYVPEPNLLATLTYDITRLILTSLQTDTPLAKMQYTGINGEIQFVDGYWQQAPIHRYRYEGEILVAAD